VTLLGASPGVSAQVWLITPTIAAQVTYTDNVDLVRTEQAKADTFAEVTPGIRVSHRGARLDLDVDYQLRVLRYVDASERDEQQNDLRASANLEAVERWMFIDARAEISQQAISAFGPQLVSSSGNAPNQRETRNYVVSPYVRGLVGPEAEYEVRLSLYGSSASDDVSPALGTTVSEDSYRLYSGVGYLRGTTGVAGLGWSADASAHSVHYPDGGRTVDWQMARAFAVYEVQPQIHLKAAIGGERNSIESDEAESSTLYAYGLDWAPSERTKLSALGEKRFFGSGHTVKLSHRAARTSWSYTDTKDVATDVGDVLSTGIETALDLITAALTAQIPDPLAREDEARRMLTEARIAPEFGRPPSAGTTRVFVERRRNLGFTWFAPRDTVAFSAYRTNRSAIGGGTGEVDDFSLSDDIRQRGFSGNWSHRLTPLITMNLVGELIRSKGSGDNSLESDDQAVSLSLATRLGVKTSGSVGLRHRRFDPTDGDSARENSVFVSLAHQF
jgi:uncharacterized protein (PEP-CTERM system associated)